MPHEHEPERFPWETDPPSTPGQWTFCDGCRWQTQGDPRPKGDTCTNPKSLSNGGPGMVVSLARKMGFACGPKGCVPSWLEAVGCEERTTSASDSR